MAVAETRDGCAAGGVEIGAARGVENPNPFRPDGDWRDDPRIAVQQAAHAGDDPNEFVGIMG